MYLRNVSEWMVSEKRYFRLRVESNWRCRLLCSSDAMPMRSCLCGGGVSPERCMSNIPRFPSVVKLVYIYQKSGLACRDKKETTWNGIQRPKLKTQNPKPKNLRQATYFACLKVESWRLLELQNFNFISEYLTKKSKILEINYGKIQEVRNWVHEICWPENSNKETHREIGPPSTCA